jgi:hypothetical protein
MIKYVLENNEWLPVGYITQEYIKRGQCHKYNE